MHAVRNNQLHTDVLVKIQSTVLPIKQNPEEKAAKLDGQIRDASQMYENYFLNEMVKAMRSTVQRDGGEAAALVQTIFGNTSMGDEGLEPPTSRV